jgi:hypothetical protein
MITCPLSQPHSYVMPQPWSWIQSYSNNICKERLHQGYMNDTLIQCDMRLKGSLKAHKGEVGTS